MRSRVMPGSSPTMERRLCVSRLNKVDLPTLGRPTMATSGSASAPAFLGTTDLRYVGKTCLQSGLRAQGRGFSSADMPQHGIVQRLSHPLPPPTTQFKTHKIRIPNSSLQVALSKTLRHRTASSSPTLFCRRVSDTALGLAGHNYESAGHWMTSRGSSTPLAISRSACD